MMRLLLIVAAAVSLITWSVVRVYDGVQFDIHCGDYLKRAADSNSVELADENLTHVVQYAKANGLTSGNTGVLWSMPGWDVGFWYQNVTSSLAELKKIEARPNATDLERSNVLLKLEKTMLDQTRDGAQVVVPDGISIFPANAPFFWWLWMSIVVLVGAIVSLFLPD